MQVSVIICTQSRANALRDCLNSVAAALLAAAPISAEIIVVGGGNGDTAQAVVKNWLKTGAFPVTLFIEPTAGMGRARNCGIQLANGDVLVFTEDDCRLHPDYIRKALAYDEADFGLVLRGGRVDPGDPADLPLSIKTLEYSRRYKKITGSARYENLGDAIFGCNMVMRRELAAHLGPFDPALGVGAAIPGGDDTDYIYRAYLAEIPVEYVPDMTVIRYHGRKHAEDGAALLANCCLGTGALLAKYARRDINFCRPFYWDSKNALKELLSRKNTFLPEISFSHRDKLAYYIKGMVRYWFHSRRITNR